jgi:hypothetical protein
MLRQNDFRDWGLEAVSVPFIGHSTNRRKLENIAMPT